MIDKINQYQDVFFIDERAFVVDYLLGTLKCLDVNRGKDAVVEYVESCEEIQKEYQKKFDGIVKTEKTIVLIPSYRCNMECEYCYEGHIKSKSPILKTKDIDEIISVIDLFINEETIDFILLGGEPICNDNIEFFLQFFSKFRNLNKKYTVSCVSNGLEISNRFEELKKLNVSRVQLTIDGLEKVHNKRKVSKLCTKNPFEEVCRSIELLVDNDINVDVRVNIDQYNIEELPALGEFIVSRKWHIKDNISFYIYPITMGKEGVQKEYWTESMILKRILVLYSKHLHLEDIFELDFHGIDFCNTILNNEIFIPKYKFCASCENQIVLDGNHKIYTCWWGANDKEFEIGQFINGEVDVNYNKLGNWNKHSINTIEKCKCCKYRYICGGGCVYKAFKRYGNINEGNCSEFYENIRMYLEYKLSKKNIYSKLLRIKHMMIKWIIEENGELIIEAEGSSMFPMILDKEKVLITKKKSIEIGDVILYTSSMEMKIHRIINKMADDKYIVKGDNENYQETIEESVILGKVEKGLTANVYSKIYESRLYNYVIKICIHNSELQEIQIE